VLHVEGRDATGEAMQWRARQALLQGPVAPAAPATTADNPDDLHYSTFLGSSGDDRGRGIAVDSAGSAYVTGTTGSIGLPTTPGSLRP
jgi:hypothetical protein